MVAIALGRGRVGVDCETLGTNRNWQAVADYFFTPAKADVIRQTGVIQQEYLFLRHWTLKEAFIKTMQGNIFGNLNDLTLENGKVTRITTRDIKQWSILQAETGNCLVGLCYRQGQIGKPVWLECVYLSVGNYLECQDLEFSAARIALLGMCAAFNKAGQMAALGGFASKMGLASGPAVTAILMTGENYTLIINVAVIGLILSLVLMAIPARLLDRSGGA